MINVAVLVDSRQNYTGIEMLGHAGLTGDRQDGQELVCAAVSALTLNMANSIEQSAGDVLEAGMDKETGLFKFRSAQGFSSGSKLFMSLLVFGLGGIAEMYGKPCIKIRSEEV